MDTSHRNLIWIASYPKSGNTWLRAFLANYLIGRPGEGPVKLDELVRITRGDTDAKRIAAAEEIDPDHASLEEMYAARRTYLARLSGMDAATFVKTHMPNAKIGGTDLLPVEVTKCAVYIVRHPFDILPSFADQMGLSLDDAAEVMASPTARLTGLDSQIRSFLGAWSMHVRSWFATEGFPVQVLRYEDMLDTPERAFRDVLTLAGIDVDEGQLAHAIEMSSFDQLAGLEARDGFIERSDNQERFFRHGRKTSGSGLPEAVRDRLLADHGAVMKHLKYA